MESSDNAMESSDLDTSPDTSHHGVTRRVDAKAESSLDEDAIIDLAPHIVDPDAIVDLTPHIVDPDAIVDLTPHQTKKTKSFYLNVVFDVSNDVMCFLIAKNLSFVGNWQVGLVEFSFPMTTPFIREPHNSFEIIHAGKVTKLNVPTDSMCTNANLIFEMNKLLLPFQVSLHNSDPKVDSLKGIERTALSNKFVISRVRQELGLNMSPTLRNIIGMTRKTIPPLIVYSMPKLMDLRRGLPQFFQVHSNLVHNQQINENKEPLLRIVPVDTVNYLYGHMQTQTFQHIQYLPITTNEFSDVFMCILDPVGKIVPFDYGSVTAILHFRKFEE